MKYININIFLCITSSSINFINGAFVQRSLPSWGLLLTALVQRDLSAVRHATITLPAYWLNWSQKKVDCLSFAIAGVTTADSR